MFHSHTRPFTSPAMTCPLPVQAMQVRALFVPLNTASHSIV